LFEKCALAHLAAKVRHCELAHFPRPVVGARRVRFERLLATAESIDTALIGVVRGYCALEERHLGLNLSLIHLVHGKSQLGYPYELIILASA